MQPVAAAKIWYRSRATGDRGYIYQDGDKVRIRLDRVNEEVSRPFVPGEWIEEAEVRNFTRMQMAQVAFSADRLLCTFLGLHTDAKLDWLSLKEERRIGFMKEGPKAPEIRRELWQAIMGVLKRHC